MDVTVVGLGNMGRAFTKRAASMGFNVFWWNRTREKVKDVPGTPIANLADARGLVVVFVADDKALFDILPKLGGEYVALAGTYSVEGVRRAVELLAARRQVGFAMPVVGSPRNVEAGDAIYLVGAPDDAYIKLRPVLEKFGVLFYVGDSVKAVALKLAYNSLLISTVAALGESLSLAIKYGVGLDMFKELLSRTVFKEIGGRYIDRMLSGGAPTFTIRNAAKDMRYASLAAGEVESSNVAISGVKALYELLTAMGYGDEDYVKAGVLASR